MVLARYLITGGAGFIGSHLVEALLALGHQVRVLDNFSTGQRENLTGVLKRIDLREVDLREQDAVRSACEDVNFILHEGALPSVPRSIEDPRTSHEVNLDGTFNVLEGARAAGVRRIVYAASSSAYGNQPGLPRTEGMAPQPVAPYPLQKLAGELYMQTYWRVYGIETVCLRYFNVFGPRQVPDSPYSGVMARFILQMMRGEQPVLFGDGEQSRDFTFVANVVQANLLAVEAPADRVSGRVFNVGCGESHTLNETYSLLAELVGYLHPPMYGPARDGDVRDSLADISAARGAFGYTAKIGFEEGLRQTVAWYREQFPS